MVSVTKRTLSKKQFLVYVPKAQTQENRLKLGISKKTGDSGRCDSIYDTDRTREMIGVSSKCESEAHESAGRGL